jgi:hypothetical protein
MKPESKTTRAIVGIFIALGILINVLYAIDRNMLGTTTERLLSVELVFFMLFGFTTGLFLPAGKIPRLLLIIPLLILFLLYDFTLFYYQSFRIEQEWKGAALWLYYPLCGIAMAFLFRVLTLHKITIAGGVIGYLLGAGIVFMASLCQEGTNTLDTITLILQFVSDSVIFLVCYGISAGTGKEEEDGNSKDAGRSRLGKIIFGLFIAIHLFVMLAAYRAPYYPNTHLMLVSALCITGYVFLIRNRRLGYRFVQASLLSMIVVLSMELLEEWIIPFFVEGATFTRSFAIWTMPLYLIQLMVVYFLTVKNSLKILVKILIWIAGWIAGIAILVYVGWKYYQEPDRGLVNDAARVEQIAMSDAKDFLENKELFLEYEPTEPADISVFEKNTKGMSFYNKEGFTIYPETFSVKIVSKSFFQIGKPTYISCKARVFSEIIDKQHVSGLVSTGLIFSEPVNNKASVSGVMTKTYPSDDHSFLIATCLFLGIVWTAIILLVWFDLALPAGIVGKNTEDDLSL